jgi:3-hydroxybutyryl-CoA dehydrogenase
VTGPGTPLPERTAVIGGGRMGAGIAHALLLAGAEVVLLEAAEDAMGAARARVVDAVRRSAERGSLHADAASVAARLTVSTQTGALAGAGLVVEAVPEDIALKERVFTAVEAVVDAGAVIASNTNLAAELGPRFVPPALLVQKVERGELGRKTGQGFYHWDGA